MDATLGNHHLPPDPLFWQLGRTSLVFCATLFAAVAAAAVCVVPVLGGLRVAVHRRGGDVALAAVGARAAAALAAAAAAAAGDAAVALALDLAHLVQVGQVPRLPRLALLAAVQPEAAPTEASLSNVRGCFVFSPTHGVTHFACL